MDAANETSVTWCLRFKTPDGMFTFHDVRRRDGKPITRAEAQGYAEDDVRKHPKKFQAVAAVYPVTR